MWSSVIFTAFSHGTTDLILQVSDMTVFTATAFQSTTADRAFHAMPQVQRFTKTALPSAATVRAAAMWTRVFHVICAVFSSTIPTRPVSTPSTTVSIITATASSQEISPLNSSGFLPTAVSIISTA